MGVLVAVLIHREVHRLHRMRRSTLAAARFLEEEKGLYPVMVTLTYAPSATWERRQVAGFLKTCREWSRRLGFKFRYVWVMELTQRGVPHYHVLTWLPRGITLPKPDKRGWWRYGMTRVEKARNAIGYLVKYVSKGCALGSLPKGARLCGAGGLAKADREKKTWSLLPRWVRQMWPSEDRPARAKGGGFLNRATGEVQPSPWQVVLFGPKWAWVEIEQREVLLGIRQ
jgi:hypothetical protein